MKSCAVAHFLWIAAPQGMQRGSSAHLIFRRHNQADHTGASSSGSLKGLDELQMRGRDTRDLVHFGLPRTLPAAELKVCALHTRLIFHISMFLSVSSRGALPAMMSSAGGARLGAACRNSVLPLGCCSEPLNVLSRLRELQKLSANSVCYRNRKLCRALLLAPARSFFRSVVSFVSQ